MPVNKNAAIRYRIIDTCLRMKYTRYTVESLLNAVSEKLREEGMEKGISRRTLFYDLQSMSALPPRGFEAPIDIDVNGCYFYTDPDFSITNCPLVEEDAAKLHEALNILKEFKALPQMQGISEVILKLEQKSSLKVKSMPSVIVFDKVENLKGLHHLELLYQYIIAKKAVEISYQTFTSTEPESILFHPSLLKEYNNRWFVVGFNASAQRISILAIDRIVNTEPSKQAFISHDIEEYQKNFANMIGVTIPQNRKIETILLSFSKKRGNYVKTKPIHSSQEIIKEAKTTLVVKLNLIITQELLSLLLSFGEDVTVKQPKALVQEMKMKLKKAFENYS